MTIHANIFGVLALLVFAAGLAKTNQLEGNSENEVTSSDNSVQGNQFGKAFAMTLLDGLLQKSQESFFRSLLEERIAYYDQVNPSYAQFLRRVPPSALLAQSRINGAFSPSTGNPWLDVLQRNGFRIASNGNPLGNAPGNFGNADVVLNNVLTSILKQVQSAQIPDPRVNALLPQLRETTNPLLPQANKLVLPAATPKGGISASPLIDLGLNKFSQINPIGDFGGLGAVLNVQKYPTLGTTRSFTPSLSTAFIQDSINQAKTKSDRDLPSLTSHVTTQWTSTSATASRQPSTSPQTTTVLPTTVPAVESADVSEADASKTLIESTTLSRVQRINQMAVEIRKRLEEQQPQNQAIRRLNLPSTNIGTPRLTDNQSVLSLPERFAAEVEAAAQFRNSPKSQSSPLWFQTPSENPNFVSPTVVSNEKFPNFQPLANIQSQDISRRPQLQDRNQGISNQQFSPLNSSPLTSSANVRIFAPLRQDSRFADSLWVPQRQIRVFNFPENEAIFPNNGFEAEPNWNINGELGRQDIAPNSGQGFLQAPNFRAELSRNDSGNDRIGGSLQIPRDFDQGFPTIRGSGGSRQSHVNVIDSNFNVPFLRR